ncbi:MAG: ATP-binding protein [Planctomycetota bacterium]
MKANQKSLYGLKWNPFSPEIPTEACRRTPRVDSFCLRVETLTREGGFALVTGEPGTGKSVALRLLVERLGSLRDVTVGILTRPQCSVPDLYRELGEIFGVSLSPHNRWAAAKVVRERWQAHIEASLARAVLVIDEAQEMKPTALSELRLLSSSRLDSRSLLTVVLCGDGRLSETLRLPDVLPVASRMRVRVEMEPMSSEELVETLKHGLAAAGNASLMTAELMNALADHAAGNLRTLMTMGAELLDVATQKQALKLDERLFFEVFDTPRTKPPSAETPRKKPPRAGGR